ncbi:hypothetical protein V2G26_014800 [Clonostachys chloroleuca]
MPGFLGLHTCVRRVTGGIGVLERYSHSITITSMTRDVSKMSSRASPDPKLPSQNKHQSIFSSIRISELLSVVPFP